MTDMVAAALRAPESLSERSLEDWDLLVRQARAAGLLARLCLRLEAAGLIDRVPEGPRDHLVSARVLTDKQGRDVRWEARCVVEALRPLGIPVLFLKGAAYVVADLPAAAGRLFSDVDVLVPRDRIDAVEETLARNGWAGSDMNDYDQQYYRRWTHQIPPMAHIRRQVTLDVHHTIVPQTARIRLASDSLLEAARPLDWPRGGMVLAPTDMVLHSATHLFNEGEFDRALRDLSDLDVLMRHFAAADAGFWTALVDRAAALDLVRPAAYALRYTRAVFDTPVPDDTLDRACRGAGLFGGRRTLMDLLFKRMLVPNHASSRNPGHGLAQWLLYVRSHHIRMPLHILLPHLARKAWRRQVGEDTV